MASPGASPDTPPSFMQPTSASQARAQHSPSSKTPDKLPHHPKASRAPTASLAGPPSNRSVNRPSIMAGRVARNAVDQTPKTVSEQPSVVADADHMATPASPAAPVTNTVSARKVAVSVLDELSEFVTTAEPKKQQEVSHHSSAPVAPMGHHEVLVEPTKRKRDEDNKSTNDSTPTACGTTSERVTSDVEPAKKKHKAIRKKGTARRQTTRRETQIEDSDDEVVVVPQRKRKDSAKTSLAPKKPIALEKPVLDDYDRRAMRETERFRRDATKGKLAKGKFLRSFNDTMIAASANRNHIHSTPTVAVATAPTLRPVTNPTSKVAPPKPTATKSVIQERVPELACVADENDPNVLTVDLTVKKWLKTGVNGSTTASVENIMKAPELYPNIEITCNGVGKPMQARVATLAHAEWEAMLKVSKDQARKQRTAATKQARKLALANGDFIKTGRVIKYKGVRRLAPNLKKS